MRKKYVSDEELYQIIKLHQSGASWLMIQNRSGVPRRSAKKAYEDWMRNQSIEELKAARVNIAAEEFREHVDLLIKLAESVVDGMKVPETNKVTINADESLYSLWEKKYRELKNYNPDKTIEKREKQRILRDYRMLLKSLQYHTREKVRWEVLDEWKQAWNNAVDYSKELRLEITEVIGNILNNQPL